MMPLQLKDPFGLFFKNKDRFPGSRFVYRGNVNLAVEHEVNSNNGNKTYP